MGFEFEELSSAKLAKSPDELRELADSEFSSVREAVVGNVHTPTEVLELLKNDRVKSISERAVARLESPDPQSPDLVDDYVGEIPTVPRISLYFSTLQSDPGLVIKKSLGLVYGTSSKIAWGFNSQAERLDTAMRIALLDAESEALDLGANAVLGLQVAVNSSQGSSAALMGSSEGVMVIGTAVIAEFPKK